MATRSAIWSLRGNVFVWSGLVLGIVLVIAGGIVLLLAWVGLVSLPFMMSHWAFLIEPATKSLSATIVSFIIGFVVGLPMGFVRAFAPRIIRTGGLRGRLLAPVYGLVSGYVQAIRGTPALVQVFLVANIASSIFRGNPDVPFWGGVLALTLNTIGYQAEVFRAGFQTVGETQVEAAKSIGMRGRQVFAYISLPQSLRLVTLPLANEWIGLFKTSALLGLVAVQELEWAASYLGNNLSHPIEAFVMVSAVYLSIIIPFSRWMSYMERKRRIPGLGTKEPERVGRRGRKAPAA